MSRRPWVTVVGNGVAGYTCARDLAAAGARVTLIGPGLPCDRPPLSKRALLAGRAPYLASAADLAGFGIDHVDGMANSVDLRRRELQIELTYGGHRTTGFEHLVWATGLRPTRPPVTGIELAEENAHPGGLERLAPALAAPGRDVIVIGAGLIGTETAATLAGHHRVTLLERADRPLERFHRNASAAAGQVIERLGVRFVGGCAVVGIEPDRGGRVVRLTGRAPLRADVVISAAGVASTLPAAIAPGGLADTDERLAVPGLDGVWVCGDLGRFPHPRYGPIAVPHWDNARAGGAHAAAAIMGATSPFVREPYWFSDIGPLRIQQLGPDAEACEWHEHDGLAVGHDQHGRPTCVLLMNAPRRLGEARRLLAA
jgi:NADPH-dependent 2,4-dienoyl-CoA reductase/sulfur reductase-like enzyme